MNPIWYVAFKDGSNTQVMAISQSEASYIACNQLSKNSSMISECRRIY